MVPHRDRPATESPLAGKHSLHIKASILNHIHTRTKHKPVSTQDKSLF